MVEVENINFSDQLIDDVSIEGSHFGNASSDINSHPVSSSILSEV